MAKTKKPILEPMTFRVSEEARPGVYRAGTGFFQPGTMFDWPERAPVIDQPSLKLEPMTQRAYDKLESFHGAAKTFAAWPDSDFGPGANDPDVKQAKSEAEQAAVEALEAANRAHELAGRAELARRNRNIAAGVDAAKADQVLEESTVESEVKLEQAEAEADANLDKLKPQDRTPKSSKKKTRASDSM